jgi:hypothetical protein
VAYYGADYGITVANLGVVFDSSQPDSVACKDYYLANRPGAASAVLCELDLTGVLGTDHRVSETITKANFDTAIGDPLRTFADANPDVIYLVCMFGIPTRWNTDAVERLSVRQQMMRIGSGAETAPAPTSTALQSTLFDSAPYDAAASGAAYYDFTKRFLPATEGNYSGTRFLITDINFQTLADCTAYIDKLKAKYTEQASTGIVISAESSRGSNYLFDANRKPLYDGILTWIEDGYTTFNSTFPSVSTTFAPDGTTILRGGNNVAFYAGWPNYSGVWGDGQPWMSDGTITFTGNSNWAAIMSYYSYSAKFSAIGIPNAFKTTGMGGSAYSQTPVIAFAHTDEDGSNGWNIATAARMWCNGALSAELWHARQSRYSMIYGDPLVTNIARPSTPAIAAVGVAQVALTTGQIRGLQAPFSPAVGQKLTTNINKIDDAPTLTKAILGSAAGLMVDAGEVTLDGGNPTVVTVTGMTSITAVTLTIKSATALGDDPVQVSYNTSGTTLNIYAWKNDGSDPTLVASTNSAIVIGWVAYGT